MFCSAYMESFLCEKETRAESSVALPGGRARRRPPSRASGPQCPLSSPGVQAGKGPAQPGQYLQAAQPQEEGTQPQPLSAKCWDSLVLQSNGLLSNSVIGPQGAPQIPIGFDPLKPCLLLARSGGPAPSS